MDGVQVHPPYRNADFGLATSGIETVLVIPDIKATIVFSGMMFNIKLPYQYFNHNTWGQCGQSKFIFCALSYISYCTSYCFEEASDIPDIPDTGLLHAFNMAASHQPIAPSRYL